MNKNIHLFGSALLLALTPALPVRGFLFSSPQSDQLQQSTDMKEWQMQTTAALNRALARAPSIRERRPNDAIVQVTFTVNAKGIPEHIELLPGDGNWPAKHAALYAIRNVDTLRDIPLPDPQAWRFLANIVFFTSEEIREQLMERLARSENGASLHHVTLGYFPIYSNRSAQPADE